MADEICGHEVTEACGCVGPCARPATSWRWYQDVGHEDCLLPACDLHENEGGRRMHDAERQVEALTTRVARLKNRERRATERARDAEAKVAAVRGLAEDSRRTGARLSALMVLDELGNREDD